MKDTRKELFHTYVEAKTEKVSYPYLEKYKVREADADVIERNKRANADFMEIKKKAFKNFFIPSILGVAITILFIAFSSVIWDSSTQSIVMITGVVVGVILVLLGVKRRLSVIKTDEYERAVKNLESSVDAIAFNLGTPSDAKTVDIISPVQKKKLDGKLGFSIARKNITYKIFKKSEDVYVIASNCLFLLPVTDVVLFTVDPKAAPFQNWDKKESYISERYKSYKIGYNSQSYTYFVRNTSELVFRINGEDHKAIIMPWSTPDIEELLNMKALIPEKKEKKK